MYLHKHCDRANMVEEITINPLFPISWTSDLESSDIDIDVLESPEAVIVTTPQSAPPALQVEVESIPSDLDRLIRRSISENNFTHLVKHSLASKIQGKRLEDGKTPLRVEFEEPKKYELTEEEKVKIERRKQRNRASAKYSRDKRKKREEELDKYVAELEADQKKLKEEVKMLTNFEKKMRDKFSDHMIRCTNKGKVMRALGMLGRPGQSSGQRGNAAVSTCPQTSTSCNLTTPINAAFPNRCDMQTPLRAGVPCSSNVPTPLSAGVPSGSNVPTPLSAGVPSSSNLSTPLSAGVPSSSNLSTPLSAGVTVRINAPTHFSSVVSTECDVRGHSSDAVPVSSHTLAPLRLSVIDLPVSVNQGSNVNLQSDLQLKIRQLELLSKNFIFGKDVSLHRPPTTSSGNGPGNPHLPICVD